MDFHEAHRLRLLGLAATVSLLPNDLVQNKGEMNISILGTTSRRISHIFRDQDRNMSNSALPFSLSMLRLPQQDLHWEGLHPRTCTIRFAHFRLLVRRWAHPRRRLVRRLRSVSKRPALRLQ